MRRVWAWSAAVGLLLGSGGDARADQPTLAGSWSAGPLIENVTVTSWVDECGPKPKSSSTAGGGFKITVSGDELVFNAQQTIAKEKLLDLTNSRSWKIRKAHDGGFLGWDWDWELTIESWGCADGTLPPSR